MQLKTPECGWCVVRNDQDAGDHVVSDLGGILDAVLLDQDFGGGGVEGVDGSRGCGWMGGMGKSWGWKKEEEGRRRGRGRGRGRKCEGRGKGGGEIMELRVDDLTSIEGKEKKIDRLGGTVDTA